MDCDLHSSLQVCGCWSLVGYSPFPGGRVPSVLEPWKLPASVSLLQPLFFPVDTNCSGAFRHRSVSPSSLLDTAISEEARQGPGLEEEQEVQEPLPGSTGRRHTLAEVSTHFSPLNPPCKSKYPASGLRVKSKLNSLEVGSLPGTLLQLEGFYCWFFSDPWFILGHACAYLSGKPPLAVPGTGGPLPVLGSECSCLLSLHP